MSEKNKKTCTTLNYIEHSLILGSKISAFASLVGIPIGITTSAVGLKICAITATIKEYNNMKEEIKNLQT